MMVFNILFFHPKSLGLCMYQDTKCKECKKCPDNKIKIKFILQKLWRR